MPLLFLLILIAFPGHIYAHEGAPEEIIQMNEEGFSPKTITIPAGTTVRFENTGSKPHWPASNIHPTHTLYPGSNISKCDTSEASKMFDACQGVPPGGSYEFTFEYAGEWKMHDHLSASNTGTIVVTGTSTQTLPTQKEQPWPARLSFWIRTTAAKTYYHLFPARLQSRLEKTDFFELAGDTIDANEDQIKFLLVVAGPDAIMKQLAAEAENSTPVRDCHPQAHRLGRLAYEVFKGKAFASMQAAACHSGFYHGAMEVLLSEVGTANLTEVAHGICKEFSTSFGSFECLHGVGHGVLAFDDYDLPTAIKECQKFTDSWEARSCMGGVFMENVVTGQGNGVKDDHHTDWLNKTDPHFPCNAIDPSWDVQSECYKMQTSWMLTQNGFDYKATANDCLNAPANMVSTCFLSFGRDAAGNSLRDGQKTKILCEYVPAAYYDNCIQGAVNVILDYWGPSLTTQGDDFCALFDDTHHESCMTLVTSRKQDLSSGK